jgi:hypothetical protein
LRRSKDTSTLLLILSNLFALVLALIEGWKVSELMWVYWAQSVVIGYFNWRRIRLLREFSTDGLRMNNRPVPPTKKAQRQVASFFAIHYGGFHAGYLAFLLAEGRPLTRASLIGIVAAVAVFAANHRFSFSRNLERDLSRKPNLGRVMLFPYARIIPMHLTIVLGGHLSGDSVGRLVLFLVLKTGADVVMHVIEHSGAQDTPVRTLRPAEPVSRPSAPEIGREG